MIDRLMFIVSTHWIFFYIKQEFVLISHNVSKNLFVNIENDINTQSLTISTIYNTKWPFLTSYWFFQNIMKSVMINSFFQRFVQCFYNCVARFTTILIYYYCGFFFLVFRISILSRLIVEHFPFEKDHKHLMFG